MPSRDPAAAAGLVVIRLWVEPGGSRDALRARITTARDPDLGVERTHTVVGADGVLAIVEGYLDELAGSASPATSPDASG